MLKNTLKIEWIGFFLVCLTIVFVIGKPFEASAERIEVYSKDVPITGYVQWWQLDNGYFRAENSLDQLQVPPTTSAYGPVPSSATFRAVFDLRNYQMPSSFTTADGKKTYPASDVKGIEALEADWDVRNGAGDGITYRGQSKVINSKYFLEVAVTSGGVLKVSNYHQYGENENGEPKYAAKYLLPMKVSWKGYIETEEETPGGGGGATPGTCTRTFEKGPGESMNASNTNASPEGSIDSDSGEFDVELGIPSSEYLRVDASSEEYLYDQSFQQQKGNVVFNDIKVSQTVTLTWTETKTVGTGKDATTIEVPKSETVTQTGSVGGIKRPFSYWEVSTFDIWKFDNVVIDNYALPGGSQTLNSNVSISADATHDPDVENHVFPPECVSVELEAITVDGGSSRPSPPPINLGEAKSIAEENIGDNEVKNDSANFNGSTIMSDEMATVDGPTPSTIPDPSRVYLSKGNLQIDPKKVNYWKSPSSGVANYSVVFSLGSASAKSFPFSVNPVTIHTPVVIYAKSSDDKEHDQRIKPPIRSNPTNSDTERHAYVLDRPFSVTLPTDGAHRNIPGYGMRDYAKYIESKQVKFPFDVYSKTKQAFYPANTWINVPVDIKTVDFFLPVWVPEGEYTVDFRAFAINYPGEHGGSEHEANVTIPNTRWNVSPAGNQTAAHSAYDSIEVDVVGRLYDLEITDISDYNWKDTFRLSDGLTPSGNKYYVGLNGIDGEPRGNIEKFTMPVHHGSDINSIMNQAVKTGYKFSFNLKTKGDMEAINDAIRIKPTFYFVNKDGKNRQEVDLYYHNDQKYFIKIGSQQDNIYRTVVLNESTRNVPTNEITNNAYHYFDFADRFKLEEKTADFYRTAFARHYQRSMSKETVETGPYGWQILPWGLRTYRGPLKNEVPSNTMIPANEIVSKEQTWYGEYSIPAQTYAVAKDAKIQQTALIETLPENHPIFLKDGYIIVNFEIETIQDGDLNNPYLTYYDAYYMSQWTDMEGFKSSFVDGYGNRFNNLEGDVMYYNANESSLDDYLPSVTH